MSLPFEVWVDARYETRGIAFMCWAYNLARRFDYPPLAELESWGWFNVEDA